MCGVSTEATVRAGGKGRLLLPREGVRWETALPPFVYAPLGAGVTVGTLRCRNEAGEVLCELPLRSDTAVGLDETQKLSFWEKLRWAWRFACRHSAGYPQYVFY